MGLKENEAAGIYGQSTRNVGVTQKKSLRNLQSFFHLSILSFLCTEWDSPWVWTKNDHQGQNIYQASVGRAITRVHKELGAVQVETNQDIDMSLNTWVIQ